MDESPLPAPRISDLARVQPRGKDYLEGLNPEQRAAVEAAALHAATPVTRIGRIDRDPGLRLIDAQGQAVQRSFSGFDHFHTAGARATVRMAGLLAPTPSASASGST